MAERCRNLVAAAVLMAPLAAAAADTTFADAISAGTASAAVRYRYEYVDQDSIAKDANASTARLRLNYRTGTWQRWSAFAEFDHVFHVIARNFNSGAGTSPGRTQYPVVADPSGSDLNQLYVDYSSSDDWSLRMGRQRLLMDNQRFVGNVGWRQNEQTYDALTFTSTRIAGTVLTYSYIDRVRRIFGDDVAAGKNKTNSHLLNAKFSLAKDWSLVTYAYYLDYQDTGDAANSTATFGARLGGKIKLRDGGLNVVAEFASQSDAASNPVNFDADYWHLDAQWAPNEQLSVGVGVESLGGNSAPGGAFRTPLATLHKFQGWADQFLATPSAGIEDLYASMNLKRGDWNFGGTYHEFSAERGGANYGNEFDVSAALKINQHIDLLLKAAIFSSDSPDYSDTQKFWLQFSAAYP